MAAKTKACKHPPARLYSWFVNSLGRDIHCVACCACGEVLKGGIEEVLGYDPFAEESA